MVLTPPVRNFGACGVKDCNEFIGYARLGNKDLRDCPYYTSRAPVPDRYAGRDIRGFDYDFAVEPFPGEPSARRHIQPLRPDIIDRWGIGPGEIVMGRPIEPSCPIQHVLRVISADPVTGILTCHTVGPVAARKSENVHEIRAYHEIGFEGVAVTVKHEPVVGYRQRFLPSGCMRQMVHSGVIQMVLKKSFGTHVRIEDLQMHGKREKLKDVTIRPGDAVSIQDPAGSRKTVVIDGIEVRNTDGTFIERNLSDESGNGDRGHGHGHGSGGGHNRRGRRAGEEPGDEEAL